MANRPTALLSIGLLLANGLSFAQTAPQNPSGLQNPTLSVTTRLIQVNVVAHNHHGDPVADLTKADFTITDQGKQQPISVFRMDSVLQPAGTPASTMPRNAFSNRLDRQSQVPTAVTVVLMDFLNTPWKDQSYARMQTLKFLRQIRPEDRVALYSMSGRGIRVIHDFTNNSQALIASLARTSPEVSRDLTNAERDVTHLDEGVDVNTPMSGLLGGGTQAEANFLARDRVINTCSVMKVLADHLAGVSGRKNLVWVSAGFPISFGFGDPSVPNPIKNHFSEVYAPYIEDASRAMGTASVAVYPVDARGLFGLPIADASKSTAELINPKTHQPLPQAIQIDNRNVDTMVYLADLTGGKAFYNSNDIGGAIRKAIDDSSVTYTLGYYTTDQLWDGKFHRIKVKVKRSGVSLRTQKGYYARENAPVTTTEIARDTYNAVWSPLDASTIGVTAQINPSPGTPRASRVVFTLNPADIRFNQNENHYDANVDLIFAQVTRRGKRLADERQTLEMKLKPETYQALLARGFRMERDLKIGKDTESIRLVVVDRGTGSVGTLTIPVGTQDISPGT